MNPLNRLVGELLRINERRFAICGFDIADHEVVIRAVGFDGRRDVVEVSLREALEGVFREQR